MVVVELQPITINLSPYGFHRYAREFHRAKQGFRPGRGYSPVPYYLTCRSLELLFKAYLLVQGRSVKHVKDKLGHDLIKALSEAKAEGLSSFVPITNRREEELKKANVYYKGKGFEYFQVWDAVRAYPHLPNLNILDKWAVRLIDGLAVMCLNA